MLFNLFVIYMMLGLIYSNFESTYISKRNILHFFCKDITINLNLQSYGNIFSFFNILS